MRVNGQADSDSGTGDGNINVWKRQFFWYISLILKKNFLVNSDDGTSGQTDNGTSGKYEKLPILFNVINYVKNF